MVVVVVELQNVTKSWCSVDELDRWSLVLTNKGDVCLEGFRKYDISIIRRCNEYHKIVIVVIKDNKDAFSALTLLVGRVCVCVCVIKDGHCCDICGNSVPRFD